MKKLFNLTLTTMLLLAAIAVTSCGGNSGNKQEASVDAAIEAAVTKQADGNKKLPFERGSYVEVTKAMGIELEKTVYFDRWGDWTATEMKTEIIKGYPGHDLEIVKGKTHWKLNLIDKTGTQFDAAEFSTGMAAALGTAMAGSMAKNMEIEKLGTENHLNYNCEKIRVKYKEMDLDVTTLNYNNLTMKMTGSMGKMEMFSEITSINLDAPPASIFEVPEGIEIEVQKF